jgi:hypothetical protein
MTNGLSGPYEAIDYLYTKRPERNLFLVSLRSFNFKRLLGQLPLWLFSTNDAYKVEVAVLS